MNFKNIVTSIIFLVFPILMYSQVAISNNPEAVPDGSAMLDISSPDKGLLIPRMEITDAESPVVDPADGLLIYNTSAASVEKGVYVWSSDDTKWVAVITSNSEVMQPYQGGFGGYVMKWGGEFGAGHWAVFGSAIDRGKHEQSDYATMGVVPKDGEIKTFAWYCHAPADVPHANSVASMIINNVDTRHFEVPVDDGFVELTTPVSVSRGDRIEFTLYSGVPLKHMGIQIYIE
jgi:hypothetical protein